MRSHGARPIPTILIFEAPQRFTEFTRRCSRELTEPERAEALTHLRTLAKDRSLTLLTARKAVDISGATLLAEMLS